MFLRPLIILLGLLRFGQLHNLPDRTICGIETDTDRVIGGTNAYIDEFTWMALIKYKLSNGTSAGFRCGGTLISNKYVLTAAHCVNIGNSQLKVDSVRLGEWQLSTEEDCILDEANDYCADPVVDVDVKEAIPHPYHNSTTADNDIAILRLARAIDFSDFIHPICLPTLEAPLSLPGTLLTAAGWGVTDTGAGADIKQKVALPVSAQDVCSKAYRKTLISKNQICAGGQKGKDTCQGDSGGPLMSSSKIASGRTQWYQEGIVSRGRGCGKEHPAVYTRVSQYIGWILQNIED